MARLPTPPPPEAVEITAARMQAAGRIAAAVIQVSGAQWSSAVTGLPNVTPGTAAADLYARILRGMIDGERTI